MRGPLAILDALEAARGQLFVWVPVFMGLGIALWFGLPFEPGLPLYLAVAGLGICAALAPLGALRPLSLAAACVALGFVAAGVRAHQIAAPMLDFRYYGPVQGRIVEIDRSQSDALRLTLDRVVLSDLAPSRTPLRVRVSLHDQDFSATPGQVILLTGFLSAPMARPSRGDLIFAAWPFFANWGQLDTAARRFCCGRNPRRAAKGSTVCAAIWPPR